MISVAAGIPSSSNRRKTQPAASSPGTVDVPIQPEEMEAQESNSELSFQPEKQRTDLKWVY